jgi:KDO2-lipid IV(A) lauroyltransferase
MRIHNAENPDVLLKVLREMKEGRSLLVYIDGNTGSGNSTEKLDTITFLDQYIQIRKGVGYMSYLSGVPILPVISYRQADCQNVLEIKDVICPNKTLSRDQYSQQVNQYLYNLLAKYLVKYPTQWEGWNYVQQFLAQPQAIVDAQPETATASYRNSYRFNYSRYSLLNLQKAPILFDKKHYTTFEISTDLYDYLTNQTYPNPKRTLGSSVFNQLLREQVMV